MSQTPSPPAAAAGPPEFVPPPCDPTTPQLTLRAVLTGMLIGGLLSACNIYTGLTIGWGLNMSIITVLVSYALWMTFSRITGYRSWSILENNIAQTAASSAAAVSSAGLVAPIPALTMLTGETLTWPQMAVWVFSVCLVGITVAIPLRRQLIVVDKLPFPGGLATAEMLKEMYAHGREAIARVSMMSGAACVAIVVKLLATPVQLMPAFITWLLGKLGAGGFHIPTWSPNLAIKGISLQSLSFGLDPSLLMVGVGGLIGFRACVSLIIGAILAWLVLAPRLIQDQYLALSVSEPLPRLPAEVGPLRPADYGYARYTGENGQLVFYGQMTAEQRESLLARSAEPAWRAAIERLYVRSQLRLAAPLGTLPPGVTLDGRPLRYDAQRGELVVTAGVSEAQWKALAAASADPAWQAALADLRERASYTTILTREFTARLGEFHKGLTLPRELADRLRIDARNRTLIARGVLSAADVRLVEQHLEAQRAEHPTAGPAADALVAAAHALADASSARLEIPATWPAAIADFATYDDATKTFVVRGALGPAEKSALLGIGARDDGFASAVEALVRASAVPAARANFTDVVSWLLWPGVALMVVSSLVSFGFSWKSVMRSFRFSRDAAAGPPATGEVPLRWVLLAICVALVLSVVLQVQFFGIAAWIAVLGVLLSFVLALVAARVSGETNTTPVGAMGKVTQFFFGVLAPASPAPNLMAANVTGGAASQCADLMHDLKTGYLIGAMPRRQVAAQMCGALAGSLLGSFFYLMMIPHPREQLITAQWPAPAVATWKAVAELFMFGLEAMPRGALTAVLIATVLGIVLPVLSELLPKRARVWVPSPASLGLAFVINGYNSVSMFIGGTLALVLPKLFPKWSGRFLLAIWAGLIAGESLTGVYVAFEQVYLGLR
jgi:uncharacterized oligopeptide transporter (OPT) family protein